MFASCDTLPTLGDAALSRAGAFCRDLTDDEAIASGMWLAPVTLNGMRSPTERLNGAWQAGLLLLSTSILVCGCIQAQRATDTGDPGFPFGPSAIGVQTLAYVQDIKPIFDRDCASCHGGREDRGDYSVRTYADVMAGQTPGDARSPVVADCSPGGSMYRYFSGDATTKSTMVFRWMVYYNALQSR